MPGTHRATRAPRRTRLSKAAQAGLLSLLTAGALVAVEAPASVSTAASLPADVTQMLADGVTGVGKRETVSATLIAPRLTVSDLRDAPRSTVDPAVAEALRDRGSRVSRSAGRDDLASRDAVLGDSTGGALDLEAELLSLQDPRDIALALMPEYGLSQGEFGCLDSLWASESDWNMYADNPISTAYGIPQALMSAHVLPADYMTNPESQIRWGLGYIRDAYGTACAAWSFKQGNNFY